MASKNRQSKSNNKKFKSALKKGSFQKTLSNLSLENLAELINRLREIISFWSIYFLMADPTEEYILALKTMVPSLNDLISFDVVIERLTIIDSFRLKGGLHHGINMDLFFPEIYEIIEEADTIFGEYPLGVEKAEYWLKPIAKNATDSSDIEAIIYFASRNQLDFLDIDELKNSWRAEISRKLEYSMPKGELPESVLDRTRSNALSLDEIIEILTVRGDFHRFFSFSDIEEPFIDATFFRAVEWLRIPGFDPWLESFIEELSLGPIYGIEQNNVSWWLFYWTRSNLGLILAEKYGVIAWFTGWMNSQLDRKKPWRVRWYHDRKNILDRDYLPEVGILLFVWNRLQPHKIDEFILKSGIEFLMQTQLENGGWPIYSDESTSNLFSTITAIHGLSEQKPDGWKKAVDRGAEWIKSQQEPGGYWNIDRFPPVILTVLALDAIALSQEDQVVTYKPISRPSDQVFLSYSRKDEEIMQKVKKVLTGVGIPVWTDEGIEPGTPNWKKAIEKAIIESDVVVVIFSPDANISRWVNEEINYAESQNKKIYPLLARGNQKNAVPFGFSSAQWIDIRENFELGLHKLLKNFRDFMSDDI